MEDRHLSEKITKNLIVIKEKTSVVFDSIIDYLIREDVIPKSLKPNLDAKPTLSEKQDLLIQLVIHHDACELFLQALKLNGLDYLKEKIRTTDISEQIGSEMACSSSRETTCEYFDFADPRAFSLKREFSRLELTTSPYAYTALKDRIEKLETERESDKQKEGEKYQTFLNEMKEMRNAFKKEKEDMRKENEELIDISNAVIKANKELRAENQQLNTKLNELQEDYEKFKKQTSDTKVENEKKVNDFKRRNEELQEEIKMVRKQLKKEKHESVKKQKQLDEKEHQLKIMYMVLERHNKHETSLKRDTTNQNNGGNSRFPKI